MRTSYPTGSHRDSAGDHQTKRPPEGGLCICDCAVDYARRSDGPLCFPRYATKPTPMKPRIIMAQVEGSGTAETASVPTPKPTPGPVSKMSLPETVPMENGEPSPKI